MGSYSHLFSSHLPQMMTPTQMKFYCRAVDPAEYVDCKRRAAEKREREGRREAALAAVTGIFAPRSTFLQQQGSGTGGGRGMETGHLESASAGGASFLPGPEGGDLMSSSAGCPAGGQQRLSEVELLAAAEMGAAVAAVQQLLGDCRELRVENKQLGQKCEQLQSKVRRSLVDIYQIQQIIACIATYLLLHWCRQTCICMTYYLNINLCNQELCMLSHPCVALYLCSHAMM